MDMLAGIRVLDLGVALAGPWAVQQLAYLGAEVIRVESRRRVDPFFRAGGDRQGNFRPVDAETGSVGFVATRVNQMSVTVDLKQPRGLDIVKRLVAESDVVAENLRCGVIDRLGLGYASLVKVKPDIIMFSSSAWGRDVPNAAYAGMAYHFAALSGLADLTGYPDGAPSEMRGAVDATNGITGAVAILAALHHRQRTGEGQYIDMSQV
ncbi:MAG: CoA transferase, partial [Chloroflexi bacterium]|nr:CoA transferase [Chloroflexota bacterium]